MTIMIVGGALCGGLCEAPPDRSEEMRGDRARRIVGIELVNGSFLCDTRAEE